ncbi:MAG TPA: EamA family transporter [Longimicrobium sp.]|nr:EamA family transporter [Longimicrobium sp.]
MTKEERSRALRLGAYAATWIIWGSTYLAIKYGVETLPPFWMAGVRSVAAGAILFAWGRLRGDALPTAAQWRAAALTGALFFLLGHGGLFWGEQRVASGPASLFVATEHLWIVLIALLGGARPSKRALAGVALGLGGVTLLTVGGAGAGAVDPLGAAVIVGCALAWAMGIVYFRGPRRPASDLFASAAPLLTGGVMLLVFSAAIGEFGRVTADDLTTRAVLSLAYLVVFGSVIAFTALTFLTRTEGPGRSASYAYVNPLVAVALGWAFAGEPLTARVVASAVAIVAAVVLVVTGTRAAPDQAANEAVSSPTRPTRSPRLREMEG